MTAKVHSDTYPDIDPTQANLSGKAVLIAGASKGLGQALALSFTRAGASYIAIGARSDLTSTEQAIQQAASTAQRPAPSVLKLTLDVADQSSTEAAAALVTQHFPRLDIIVNNAGVLINHQKIADSDPREWQSDLSINLFGPYLIARAFLPFLLLRPSSPPAPLQTFINVSSVGAHCVSPTLSSYQIAKLASVRLMEFVHAEYADRGVVAFSVHPGNMLTDIVGRGDGMSPELKAVFTDTPTLAADTMVFLARERREWLSGRYVNCTWDMPEFVGEKKREEIVRGDRLRVKLVV